MADVKVTRNDDEARYELHVPDENGQETLAGFARFEEETGRVRFTGTEIDPAFRGQGLGDVLASEALADAAQRGDTIVPVCPFIASYLTKNEVAGAVVDWPGETPTDAATPGESSA
ncbi:GNAT family N-acetyltransferase [Microbacterium marinilacus]|uniref:N-acetyltransferase domain-containing protein n=1 Tax=Microbacterium marinilacus TaxID=415209 RepID=A0ABP7BHV9_9MICO|nr:GNAT family N-acetyltransferase [Microbacterium marinilacus]MBY0690179.1 N-acetyltransferase [Microbacterium marinilacus]